MVVFNNCFLQKLWSLKRLPWTFKVFLISCCFCFSTFSFCCFAFYFINFLIISFLSGAVWLFCCCYYMFALSTNLLMSNENGFFVFSSLKVDAFRFVFISTWLISYLWCSLFMAEKIESTFFWGIRGFFMQILLPFYPSSNYLCERDPRNWM